MNELPFKPKHTYYGDEWLEFNDYLNTLSDREGIFIELSFGFGLINPHEMTYKTGAKNELLSRIKCLIEVDREPDKSKHAVILKKYHVVVLPTLKKQTKDNMYA